MNLGSCCSRKCADVLGKILQVLVLAAIVLVVVSLVISIGIDFTVCVVILIIVYVLYLIAEFCSTTASFLCNKTNENGIQIAMQKLISTPPTIEFYCECYHYETRGVSTPPKKGGVKVKKTLNKKSTQSSVRSGGGNLQSSRTRGGVGGVRTQRQKVTTWRETVTFPYYSARDVSGLFQLNKSREAAMGKVYVKLELTPEINFADELTYMDYENFRSDFYNRNRSRDQYMDYRETRSVPGLNTFNLINIRKTEPCGISICMFVFFTILPFAEFYKCYVNSYCLEQQFKIRKLISTRYDLNMDQYQYFVPSFDVPEQQYAYDPSYYNYINNDYQVKKPTDDEISRAAMYKNQIPKYECTSYTSINGQIKVGVVQDDPAYCSVNVNQEPPPSCQNLGPQQPYNNNMNMNINMNMHNRDNNMNGIDSNNNMNYNNGNNYNNMNQNESYSEEEQQGYAPYSGGV